MPTNRSGTFLAKWQEALRVLGWPLVLLLLVALVLGGGGVRHGLTNLVVQIVALGILLLYPGILRRFRDAAPKSLIILVALTFLLPIFHLIPLPAGIWQALPGREMALQSRELVNSGNDWFPLTLDRARTVTALVALVGPLAVIACFRFGSNSAPRHALALLVTVAFVQFAFGVIQFAAGGDTLTLYETNQVGRFYGFFVSHIASGLVMVVGLCALVGHYLSEKRSNVATLLYLAGGALLVIGVILTNSRSAVALLILPGLWVLAVAAKRAWVLPRRTRWGFLAAGIVGAMAIAAVFATNDRLGRTWDRFDSFEDSRPDIWEDTLVGIDRYWPVGSGMGTFDEVFQVEESLEMLVAKKAARAHNEYLEILLEAGIFGAILVVLWFVYLAYAAIRGLRSVHAPVTLAAAMAVLCFALQALVYFPLRNMAELCVAGLLVALLTAPLTIKRDRGH